MLAHGHPNEPDAVQMRLNVSNPQLLKALKLDPYVRVQTVCSASADLTADCETHSSEWTSISSDSNTWAEEECTESHPYLVGARCATSNGLPTPAAAGPDATTPEIDAPSGPEVTDVDSSERDQSEPDSCDLTTYPAATGATTTAAAPGQTSAEVYSPDGSVIASVVANGTGCPAGTWKSEISDDGTTFTTTFNAYKAIVQPGDAIDVKDCQLSVQVQGAAATSYALESFTFNGLSKISEGVTAARRRRDQRNAVGVQPGAVQSRDGARAGPDRVVRVQRTARSRDQHAGRVEEQRGRERYGYGERG
jgi:hypothetical protein